MRVNVEVISGVEGPCLSINEYRVAGPKPWGGGQVTKSWVTSRRDILAAFLGAWTTQPAISGRMLDRIEAFIDQELQGEVRK